MKKTILKLLSLSLLTTSLLTVPAFASNDVSMIDTTTKISSYSTSEALTVTSTPVTSQYSNISGYAKDSNGNPLANRKIALAINFSGVPSQHSVIQVDSIAATTTTNSSGYYKFNLIPRSSYNASYNPGKNCSYYVYLDNGKYTTDQIVAYYQSSQWPFNWIINGNVLLAADVRTYLYS